MDIYLASNCVFGMGGGTGSKGVALVFRRPLLHLISDIHEFRTYQEKQPPFEQKDITQKIKKDV